MLIGIEAERANNPLKTGVEHYAKQLILHLAEIDAVNSYVLYLRSQPEEWLKRLPGNFKIKVMPFPLFWTQIRLSLEMLLHPVDVLLIPASALPIIHPKRSVAVVHDIGWKYFPDSFTPFMRHFLEWSTKFAVKNASKIIAVSESTKRDLLKFYKVDGNKVQVVHHGYSDGGVGASFSRPQSETGGQALPLHQSYILFLSTLQPRKNLEGLIDAFLMLKKENPEFVHKLVVAGKPGWKFEAILRKIEKHRDFVVYLDYVSDQDRQAVLSHADLLVVPSFYEGFGMQILEAFAANVPVATSKISSMPEVAGDAAIYFDPRNVSEIKNAIKSILMDKSLADSLRQKGKERLKDFSWQKCAKETLEVLAS